MPNTRSYVVPPPYSFAPLLGKFAWVSAALAVAVATVSVLR
jgi:hypothetical protein